MCNRTYKPLPHKFLFLRQRTDFFKCKISPGLRLLILCFSVHHCLSVRSIPRENLCFDLIYLMYLTRPKSSVPLLDRKYVHHPWIIYKKTYPFTYLHINGSLFIGNFPKNWPLTVLFYPRNSYKYKVYESRSVGERIWQGFGKAFLFLRQVNL